MAEFTDTAAVNRDVYSFEPGTNANVAYPNAPGLVTSNVADPAPPVEAGRDLTP